MVSTIAKISSTGSPDPRPAARGTGGLPAAVAKSAGAVADNLRHADALLDHVRFDHSVGMCLGRIGALELRLAQGEGDVVRAQRLRYQVFYEEMAAQPDAFALVTGRDADAFDAICDHLLVLDHGKGDAPEVVGTYRLLRQEVARHHGGFYTASEYAIGPLLEAHPDANVLELGRSCVLAPYRNKRTVELLWHGIWSYVLRHRIDVMLGCASLAGTDPEALALSLSFLAHFARAPEEWCARAHAHLHVPMARMPREAIDPRAALASLPPLIKGYLRLGAGFGDGAVVDRQFGTTDVFVVLPVSRINPRYVTHFGADAGRHA
ncbi:MAG: putative hemolysin [Saliniramus fredricksonii]|uniref:L-ornithine N(alpha)-acyltransferase n=1 Tax=Saliniramus fredricksonii TaxID=1653334 RepID=A0A0P7X5W5_9HYPH|nr:GNAT family N-acyltransferase [Saliniramus fredricksonii]KPQ10319.1 MAG: putative hemolysin [Saliniramus fredricksonii]SCC79727.1 Putative hemolysin [Saliniramus fredricksonii]